MNERNMLSGLLVLTAMAVSLTLIPQQFHLSGQALGETMEGMWVGLFTLSPAPPGSGPIPTISIFHRDGTIVTANSIDGGFPPGIARNSANLGTWVRTGPRSLRAVTMNYAYDPVTGAPVAILKFEAAGQLIDSDHLQATIQQKNFACGPSGAFPFFTCPDPLTALPTSLGPALNVVVTRVRP